MVVNVEQIELSLNLEVCFLYSKLKQIYSIKFGKKYKFKPSK